MKLSGFMVINNQSDILYWKQEYKWENLRNVVSRLYVERETYKNLFPLRLRGVGQTDLFANQISASLLVETY